jgi:hypothetical protein
MLHRLLYLFMTLQVGMEACRSAVSDDGDRSYAITCMAGLYMSHSAAQFVHFLWIASQGTGGVDLQNANMATYWLPRHHSSL